MNKYIIIVAAILFFVSLTKADAIEGYEIVAKSNDERIVVYARKINDVYQDFKIDYKGAVLSRPFWINDTNPAYSPRIIYEDINKDDKKELIIILTKGHGTGVLEQEAHIFHIDRKAIGKGTADVPTEVLVDNPLAIIKKNVKTKLTRDNVQISIGDQHYTMDLKPLGINPKNLFDDVSFGNIITFDVIDNQFIAKIGGQISPVGGYIGEVVIVYEYRDEMYQASHLYFEEVFGVGNEKQDLR
ncbi:hypothetical protein [Sporosarcina sp. UB5]|uniref:hypothetical protein n=1 Tax=Sporosarcina sp. UB5 TaxID=3047463 RepID=UPI003D7960BD